MRDIQAGIVCLAFWVVPILQAQDQTQFTESTDTPDTTDPPIEEDSRALPQSTQTSVNSSEDPEDRRRAERLHDADKLEGLEYELYGSVRLHAINEWDPDSDDESAALGDGASRLGVSGSWYFLQGWNLFGRLEAGFDVLDTFTAKSQTDDDDGALTPRLHNVGLESDTIYLKLGKSWSTYYKVAGEADRFAIFGGNAVGIYNAGTDGGATGTGRADNAVQTLLYIDTQRWVGIKPFNLNIQYQSGENIPHVAGHSYGTTLGLSAWLETEKNYGVGVAWHRAQVKDLVHPEIQRAGIDGDAQALALAFKTYGKRWLASLVIADLENVEATDQNIYFNGTGAELFTQWQFRERWWLTAGGNWLKPDNESTQVGEYEVKYFVAGMRYTFDSFNRMVYAEWRSDSGHYADGSPRKSEFTVGVRWDFDNL